MAIFECLYGPGEHLIVPDIFNEFHNDLGLTMLNGGRRMDVFLDQKAVEKLRDHLDKVIEERNKQLTQ